MQQVIVNLLSNVIDANQNRRDNPWVELAANKSNDQITITVHDSGEGIDQQTVAKLFAPFFTTFQPKGNRHLLVDSASWGQTGNT